MIRRHYLLRTIFERQYRLCRNQEMPDAPGAQIEEKPGVFLTRAGGMDEKDGMDHDMGIPAS